MWPTLRVRLLAAFLLVGAVSVTVAGLIVDRTVRSLARQQVEERLRYEVTMTGQMTASALFAPLAADDTSLQGAVAELGAAVHTHLAVVTPEGAIVADSEKAPGATTPSAATDPEVQLALAGGKGTAVRGLGEERRLWVAEEVARGGKVLGVVRASVPMAVIEEEAAIVRRRLVGAVLVAMVLAGLMAIALALGISRPVGKLAAAARRIGQGELDTPIDVRRRDEIGELGASISEMAANLKKMIAALDHRNAEMRQVLDSVDQGLVVANLEGVIQGERSSRVDEWFAKPSSGTSITALFREASARDKEDMELSWRQMGDGILPLELLLDQLPKRIVSGGRTFDFVYAPVAAGSAEPSRILVVITDTTAVAEAERKQSEQKDLLGILGRYLRDRSRVRDFIDEADRLVAATLREEDPLAARRRAIHTLKGACALHGVIGVAAVCHEIESRIAQEEALDAETAERLTARWRAFHASIDVFFDMGSGIVVSQRDIDDVVEAILRGESREAVVRRISTWAFLPVAASLSVLADGAQAVAERLGKNVVTQVEHDDTRLSRERWAPLWAALVHAVRNAVDHGLERSEQRIKAGKRDAGVLRLAARETQGMFHIEVEDDGAGIPWARLAQKLKEAGLPADTDEQLVEGLFADGVSTAEEMTDLSGRGIGLGALRSVVHSLGGTIQIRSRAGKGTLLLCRFPPVAEVTYPRPVAGMASMSPPSSER